MIHAGKRTEQANLHRRFALLRIALLIVFFLNCPIGQFHSKCASAQERVVNADTSFVTTESAEYRGRIDGDQIVGGKFAFQIVRRGSENAWIDWSLVRIAMNNLAWEKQALIAGTTPDQRSLLLTQRDSDTLTGDWSLSGQVIGQTTVFDLQLPPALNSRLLLDVPSNMRVDCRQGLLRSGEIDVKTSTRLWTLELGGVSSASLLVSPADQSRPSAAPRYEIDAEYRARRDGVFLRTDLTIDGTLAPGAPLKLDIPPTLEIQSVALVSSGPQGNTNLPFQRPEKEPRALVIPTESLIAEGNVVLRIRGFEAVTWKGRRTLPRLRWTQALETKRNITLRVEPPLQLQWIDPGDLLQTALMSDETAGELWRFEARDPSTELNLQIGLPDSPLSGELVCLTDARPDAGWTVAIATLSVENGARFETSFQLPEDWKLISVSPHDAESRISSWEVNNQVLSVTWQNAMTRTSPRQVRLLARTPLRRDATPFRLTVPQIRGANPLTIQYQLLLPTLGELQLLEGENWKSTSGHQIQPILRELREVTERLSDSGELNVVTLRSSSESRPTRLLVSIIPPEGNPSGSVNAESISPTNSADESSETSEKAAPVIPPVGVSLELLTMAGQSNPRECVQHAVLLFDRPIPLRDFQLRLPEECRLSVVKLDDQPITVFRSNNEISIPAEFTQATRIQLTYITPATVEWLNQRFVVPLPRITLPIQSFRWSLDLPGVQQLSQVELPGQMPLGEPQFRSQPPLFGPLSRGESEETFNPFSPTSWASLLARTEVRAQHPGQPRRIWNFVAPGVGTEAVFTTWNASLARSYAWVAVFGCLLIGLTARLFHPPWLRNASVIWVLTLIILISQATPPRALVLGGMLAGSLLALTFPRRWIQRRDLLARSIPKGSPIHAVTGMLFLVAGIGGLLLNGLPVLAQTPVVTAEPVSLIRSARYTLLKVQPVSQVKAVFEVLTRQGAPGILLKLPLQDVVFHTEAICLVDGHARPLIPAKSGDAMLINIDQQLEESGTRISGTDWTRHEIEVLFSLRSDQPEVETGFVPVRGIVPKVLDSVLILPEGLPVQPWQHFGEVQLESDRSTLVALGAIGRLMTASSPQISATTTPLVQSMQTSLDVSALRIRCLTRIHPTASGWPNLLPLTFPTGAVISSVTGPNVIDWINTVEVDDTSRVNVRLRTDGPAHPLLLTYEFPPEAGVGATLTIPEIRLVDANTIPHSIGITGPPLTTLSLVNRAGMTLLTPEDWQAPTEAARSKPSLIVLLKAPTPISLDFVRMNSIRSAEINETLKVQRDALNYTAVIKINVTEAPSFRHQFRIDPQVHIESVNLGASGNDGAVRFTRDGNLVTLYVAGGQLGERTYHLTARLPSTIDVWNSVPRIEPVNTVLTGDQLTIQDQSGWDIELEGLQGKPISIAPEVKTEDATVPPAESFRLIGTFSLEDRPQRLRVAVPARAIHAESVTVLQTHSQQDWEQISTIRFTASEAPLRKIIIRIPSELIATRVRPSLFAYSIQPYGTETLLTIRVPERYSSSATITVSSRLTSEFMKRLHAEDENAPTTTIPQLKILSAAVKSQSLLMQPDPRLQLNGAVRAPASSLPMWVPSEWTRDVQNETLICYQQNQPTLTLQRMTSPQAGLLPTVRLEETILWPENATSLKGLTRWWLLPKETSELTFTPPKGVSIENISVYGNHKINYEITDDLVRISWSANPGVIPISIHWSSQGTEKRKPLLEAPLAESGRRFTAILTPTPWTVTSGNGTPLDRARVCLERWQTLLQCWRETGHSPDAAHLIASNIEQCRQILSESVDSPPLTTEQLETFQKLSADWRELNAGQAEGQRMEQPTFDSTNDMIAVVLAESFPSMQVNWMHPPEMEWTGRVGVRRSGIRWWSLFSALSLLLAVGWGLWRFPKQITTLREWVSLHPLGVLMGLGILWWLFFSPSAFGLLVVIVSASLIIREKLARRWNMRRKEQATTSAP